MNILNPFIQGFVFAGCFIGAGYVSGQELWQYFGGLKAFGLPSLALTLLLIYGVSCMIMLLARKLNTQDADHVMVPWNLPALRGFACIMEGTMLFALMAIMTAGVGALLNMMTGLPHAIGCAAFTVLVLLTALRGMDALVSAFSAIVPMLVIATLILGITCVIRWGYVPLTEVETMNRLEMRGGWIGHAINYMCYNVFGAVTIFCPIGYNYPKGRRYTLRLLLGNAIGTLGLSLIAICILITIASCTGADMAELPMLHAAACLAPWVAWIYAFLLCCAMFGACLTASIGFIHYFSEKTAIVASHEKLSLLLLCIGAYAASLFGFGDLISVIYPLFGYASAIFIILMLIRFLQK